MNKFSYEKEKYNFREIIQKILEVERLDTIHIDSNFPKYDLFSREKDQSSIYHKRFYSTNREFLKLYDLFIKDCIRPRFDEAIIYQKIPTFRLHFPNNVAVGEWHKDKKYRDLDWAEDVKEINYFLPLTRAYDSNTIWVESQENKEDFKPMEAEYGEIYEWNGSDLTHGNKQNKTNFTRVSVDFRVITKSLYYDSGYLTINTKVPFSVGNYYKECK